MKFAMLAAAVALAAAPAFAQDQVQFQYKAEELQTAEGVAALYKRLENRANAACAVDNRAAIYAKTEARRCKKAYIKEVVDRIGHPQLSAIAAAAASKI